MVISTLRHEEELRLDRTTLDQLYTELGETHADRVVSRAIEELAVRLARLVEYGEANDLEKAHSSARAMCAIADQVGMVSFARVCEDVGTVSMRGDHVAFHACLSRLKRIGEDSLMALWGDAEI